VRFGLVSVLYIVIGVLVAAGIIGDEGNFFSNLDNIEAIVEMLLAVILWPLVLLGVSLDIGGGGEAGGGGDAEPKGGGGSGGNGAGGGK